MIDKMLKSQFQSFSFLRFSLLFFQSFFSFFKKKSQFPSYFLAFVISYLSYFFLFLSISFFASDSYGCSCNQICAGK